MERGGLGVTLLEDEAKKEAGEERVERGNAEG